MNKQKLMDRLLPVVTSEYWDRLEDYLQFERTELIATLIASSDIKQINKLQGEIRRLDSLLALPHTVKRNK